MTDSTGSASIDIRELFDRIRFATEHPVRDLRECVDRSEESAPVLVDVLEAELAHGFRSDDDLAVPYAMLLLAQMRHRPAYPVLSGLARHPQAEEFLGELLTEAMGRCLAACWDGNVSSLRDLVEDASLDENPRGQGVVALVCLAVAGERARETVLADIKGLLREALRTESSEIASACVIGLWDLFPDAEAEQLVREVYAKGLVDDEVLPLADLDEVLQEGFEAVWGESALERMCSLRVDAEEDSRWWSCWGEDEDEDGNWVPPEPLEQLKSEKVGRNDPCPCASGKKYKKCCGKDV